MVRIEVVVVEHGREYRYTVAQEASVEDAHDVIERLTSYFSNESRVLIVDDEAD